MSLFIKFLAWTGVSLLFLSIALIYHDQGKYAWTALMFSWMFERAHGNAIASYRERLDRENADIQGSYLR